jgi:hypothetical protein
MKVLVHNIQSCFRICDEFVNRTCLIWIQILPLLCISCRRRARVLRLQAKQVTVFKVSQTKHQFRLVFLSTSLLCALFLSRMEHKARNLFISSVSRCPVSNRCIRKISSKLNMAIFVGIICGLCITEKHALLELKPHRDCRRLHGVPIIVTAVRVDLA